MEDVNLGVSLFGPASVYCFAQDNVMLLNTLVIKVSF